MIVRVDGTSVVPGASAGIETFTYGLLRGLSAQPGVDLEVVVRDADVAGWSRQVGDVRLTPVASRLDPTSRGSRLLRRVVPVGVQRSRALVVLRRVRALSTNRATAVADRGEVAYAPFHRVPVTAGAVVTAHDLRVFRDEFASAGDQAIVRRNLDRCGAVVASWPHPFHDVRRRFPQHAHKQFLVPLPVFNPPSDAQRPTQEDDLLLYPASTAPHKNHEVLLRAMAELPRARLVCAGPTTPDRLARLEALVSQLRLGGRVRFPGFVPAAALQHLFARCAAVVVPSLWEAASGPVFEALAWGKPVIASDIGPVRDQLELVGAPAELFDPRDHTALAGSIDRVLGRVARGEVGPVRPIWLTGRTWSEVAADYTAIFRWVSGCGDKPTHLQDVTRWRQR